MRLFCIAGPVAAAIAALPAWGEESSCVFPMDSGHFALTMEIADTEDGSAVISLDELRRREFVPKRARKLYRKALKADRRGLEEKAERRIQQAISIAPEFAAAHAAVAVALIRNKEFEDARRHIDTALKLNAHYLPGREIEGILEYHSGRFSASVQTLQELLRDAPGRVLTHYYLARGLCELDRGSESNAHLERARELARRPLTPLNGDTIPSSSSWPPVWPRR